MSAIKINERLRLLEAERAAAGLEGLDHPGPYFEDLLHELAVCRAAYVGAAVTEIAVLRGQLGGRLQG